MKYILVKKEKTLPKMSSSQNGSFKEEIYVYNTN